MLKSIFAAISIFIASIFGGHQAAPAPQAQVQNTPTNTTASAQPAASAAGTIVSATPQSITVATKGGNQTFVISASTIVKSVVAAGEVGKNVSQLTPGMQVLVVSMQSDPTTAQTINVPPPPPPTAPAIGAVGLSGSMVSVSESTLTLKLGDGTTKKVAVNAKTEVLSNVSAGQTGTTLSGIPASSSVQVLGTVVGGVTTAVLVLLINN